MRVEYVFKCDKPGCGKEFRGKAGASVDFHVDYSRDITSGASEKEYTTADLCSACYGTLVEELLSKLEMPDRAIIAKQFGAK